MVNFTRIWNEYKDGFGDPNYEFWLGNEKLHLITKPGNIEIRFELKHDNGIRYFATFSTFKIEGEVEKYKLLIDGYDTTSNLDFVNYLTDLFL